MSDRKERLEQILEKYPVELQELLRADFDNLLSREMKDWEAEVQQLLGNLRVQIDRLTRLTAKLDETP